MEEAVRLLAETDDLPIASVGKAVDYQTGCVHGSISKEQGLLAGGLRKSNAGSVNPHCG